MTDRQRFNNQMHHRPVDRCFNMEFGYWENNFEDWAVFVENNVTSNEEADLFFSFDVIHGVSSPWMHPLYEEKIVSETETSYIMMRAEGLVAEVPKDGRDTIPHFLKSSIQSPDDWKRCKEERFRRDDPVRCVDIEHLKRAHPRDRDYPLGVHCGSMIGKIRDLLTLEGLAYATYDYPDMVEDMVETHCLLIEDFLDRVLPHVDFDFASGWEDICFNGGPIVSFDFFQQVVVPRYTRISRKLGAANIDIWYTDCDGDLREIIPLLLEGGMNCLFPFEVNSSGHPGDMLDRYGPELRIMGGVDKMALAQGRGAILAYLRSLVPHVQRGGFIPFCDHRCPPNVNENDYLFYLDMKEQMFGNGNA